MGKWLFQSKGKKIFLTGVQAHNSSAYTAEEMETAWKACHLMNANTMEVPIYWDKIEPEEGKFDFEMIDYLIAQARENKKHLVLLWFASWKNGNMRYCPLWVKKDKERFRRALTIDGVAVASLSPHNEECRNADARAFRAVMKHIAEIDSEEQTLIAIQVENEPGMLARTPFDFGPDGQKAIKEPVPAEVIDFIEKEGKGNEYETWVACGKKRGEAWVETFGKRGYDLCSAYGVATYIGQNNISTTSQQKVKKNTTRFLAISISGWTSSFGISPVSVTPQVLLFPETSSSGRAAHRISMHSAPITISPL